jgi:Icc-related predicted phosphoesterase
VKFVAIADTHCRHHNLKLPKGDVILHAGDVSYKGQKQEVLDFLQWFSRLDFKHKIFIAGNHDFYFEQKRPEEIKSLIPENVTYLNDSGVDINGIQIWGSPITPWYFNWAFNRPRGGGVKKHWQMISPNTDILMTHGPVYGIHDMVVNGNRTGCKDLLETVRSIKPKVHVCGHIHEGYGEVQKENTKFINASVLNDSYELVNKPVVFEL